MKILHTMLEFSKSSASYIKYITSLTYSLHSVPLVAQYEAGYALSIARGTITEYTYKKLKLGVACIK